MRELLGSLAIPRLHGSAGADRVAAELQRLLEDAGWTVTERPFAFSDWPGRFAVPVFGLVLAVILPTAGWLLATGSHEAALVLLLLLALLVLGVSPFTNALIMRLHWRRRQGTNLLALPARGRPKFLVVAHRDSKSQPVPLVLRVTGAILVGAAWVALVGLAVSGSGSVALTAVSGATGAAGGAVIGCCIVGNRSAGALDNATGAAALVGLARLEQGAPDVALLVTDAEELGLAGARAEAGSFPDIEAVINLDGLDDRGPFRAVESRAPFVGRVSALAQAFAESAAASGVDLRRSAGLPGLWLDHIPFARKGHQAVTIMRGTLASLARVHRPSDRVDRLDGTGAADTVALVRRALGRLRGDTGDGTMEPTAGERVARTARSS